MATALAAIGCALLLAACGGAEAQDGGAARTPAVPPAASPATLWDAEGRPKTTLPEDRPADSAAHWSGQRYATHAQLAHDELHMAPLTLVIDADDEAAVAGAMSLGEQLAAYGSDKSRLALFVRSKKPALAARLAEQLTAQGWANVFVVF